MKGLFSPHIELTGKVMDMQLERQNVVMANLANIKTPGYKALDIEWEQQLQAALGNDARGKMTRTEQGHMPAVFSADSFGSEWTKAFQPPCDKRRRLCGPGQGDGQDVQERADVQGPVHGNKK